MSEKQKPKNDSACLVCGELATVESYGYTFCDKHKKYAEIDPESLEMRRVQIFCLLLVIWRLKGKSVEEIEALLNNLQDVK